MQAIAPVTNAQLLQADKDHPLLKFEIHDGVCWIDLTIYVVKNSLSISSAGAEMTPSPIAGKWGIILLNKNGRFDPDVDTYAPYNEYLRVGRRVKISIGSKFDGVDYYWRRIYGFMDLPKFSIDACTVTLRGFDNMQLLTDTKLRMPNNYWGTFATFDSVSTEGTLGAEIYNTGAAPTDAMDIDDNLHGIGNWLTVGCTFTALTVVPPPAPSTEVGRMRNPVAGCHIRNVNVGAAVAGSQYKVVFEFRGVGGGPGDGDMRFEIHQTAGICKSMIYPLLDAWQEDAFYFTALDDTPIQIWIYGDVGIADLRIDVFSIKKHTLRTWHRYQMPDACTGVYYVTLDDEPVWPGKQKGEGWYYDSGTNQFYFDYDKDMEDGTDNLIVYYFTVQEPEEIVADLLVTAGLYNTQAEALADMIHTLPPLTIDQVWFKKGTTITDAIRKVCERCNYRFYFNYSGRPVFLVAPTAEDAGDEDFTFTESQVTKIQDYEDRAEIRNRIVIEGLSEAMPEGAEETRPSELKGESSDIASINRYGEHTWTINNHLFQDQATIDTFCDTYLAAFKDPKMYTKFTTPFNPVPLIKGDTVAWRKQYEETGTPINQRGIIRDIQIKEYIVSYKIEKVTQEKDNGYKLDI